MADNIRAWRGFADGPWQHAIDVRDFIQRNYAPYDGDENFLADISRKTKTLLGKYTDLLDQERARGGVLDIDTSTISSPTDCLSGLLPRLGQ